MKTIKLMVALLLAGAAGVGNAWEDGDHVRFGMMIGPYSDPWGYPPYYYPPPYYPPVVIQHPVPQVYIERHDAPVAPPAPAAAAPANYWYYCAAAKGYYPYIKECPGGWQKVTPHLPTQP